MQNLGTQLCYAEVSKIQEIYIYIFNLGKSQDQAATIL